MLNYKFIANRIGVLMLLEAALMLPMVLISFIYQEPDLFANIISVSITFVFGLLLRLFAHNHSQEIGKKEGYFIVSIVWIIFSVFGAIPYYLSGYAPSYTDAFFETMSGFTTTGATIFPDVEILSHSLLFWRSLTQYIGGIGILVLLIAILPVYGVGNMMLYQAEYSGANFGNKLKPRVNDVVRRIVKIYFVLAIILCIILVIAGMPFFDSICHTLATISTGGFSTKNAGLALYSPLIQYTVLLFMFISGTNYTLLYFATHKQISKLLHDDEFKWYAMITFIVIFIIAVQLVIFNHYSINDAIRNSSFQTISLFTSTGFVIDNYSIWTPLSLWIIFIIMMIGGCAGSTAGGIKMVRVVIIWKMIVAELKKIIHHHGIIPVRLNDTVLKEDILIRILSFLIIYAIIAIFSITILLFIGVDTKASIYGSISCLSNIGPGLGSVYSHYASIPAIGKWVFSFLMLIGRLEIYTVLIIVTRNFWRQI